MKNIFLFVLALIYIPLFAQDITGSWKGTLKFQGGQIPLIFNISGTGNGHSATMDSPNQGAKGIPVTTVTFSGDNLVLAIPAANIEYRGTLTNNTVKGTYTQNGNVIPLDLVRGQAEIKKTRPQEPLKPYPYHTEDVVFRNEKAGITLAGTLSMPKKEGNFPAVVLITGSGGQNRDEELLGHKPFLVLADHLTRSGIAVLRYDDRGVGASQGVFEAATSADFATDAEAAFSYLKTRKEINKKKIGLAGHSEGGTIAPVVAATNPDVAFIVLMAAGNISGDELMMLQNYMLGKASGMPETELTRLGTINRKLYTIIKQESAVPVMKEKLTGVFTTEMKPLLISKGISEDDVTQYINMQVTGLSTPWYTNFIRFDPAATLEKIKCPVLALNGDKDLQVAPIANLEAVKRAGLKSGNKNITAKQLPGLNHLFQESTTGLPAEYGEIDQTISPIVLSEISSWINKQVK
jgi:pimeloyl-ACP methyl ester carboxylesterase